MELTFDLLGTPFGVRCLDRRSAERIMELFECCDVATGAALPHDAPRIEPSPTDGGVVLTWRNERIAGRRSPVLARLVALVTAAAIDGYDRFAAHAGVVVASGGAVVLAAPSGTGKSTLTAACVLRGLGYLSDEALCLDRDAHAVPFPKPLAIGADGATLLGIKRRRLDTKDLLAPSALRAAVATESVPVRHVVALRRTGRTTSTLEEDAPSSSVVTLLEMSFNAHRDPDAALASVSQVAEGARSWRLDVGNPFEAADLVRDLPG